MIKVYVCIAIGNLWFAKALFAELEYYPVKEENIYKYEITVMSLSGGEYKSRYLIYKNNQYIDSTKFRRSLAQIDSLGDTTYNFDTCTINDDRSVHCNTPIKACFATTFCLDEGITMHPIYSDTPSNDNFRVERTLLSGNGNRIMVFDTLLGGMPGTRTQYRVNETYSDKYGLLRYYHHSMYGVGYWIYQISLVEFNGASINADSLLGIVTNISNRIFQKPRNTGKAIMIKLVKHREYLVNGKENNRK